MILIIIIVPRNINAIYECSLHNESPENVEFKSRFTTIVWLIWIIVFFFLSPRLLDKHFFTFVFSCSVTRVELAELDVDWRNQVDMKITRGFSRSVVAMLWDHVYKNYFNVIFNGRWFTQSSSWVLFPVVFILCKCRRTHAGVYDLRPSHGYWIPLL